METRRWGVMAMCLFGLAHCGDAAEERANEGAPASSAAMITAAPSGAPASGAPAIDGPGAASGGCAIAADCDDHDPCTIDRCTSRREGELDVRACEHVASPSCAQTPDAGAPDADAQPPVATQPSCSPLAGTLSTMPQVQRGDALEGFHDVWCCIGRLGECTFPVGTCIAGQITETQALGGAECTSVGSHGTCQDDDAVWAVRCDATVLCRIACDGTCVPEACN